MKQAILKLVFLFLLAAAGCSAPPPDEAPAAAAAPTEGEIAVLAERLAGARMALLGEASHGTREFYEWRKAVSRRLIEEHGFDFIVVEGDWPAHHRLNLFVKGKETPEGMEELFSVFDRWPPWMWRNDVTVALVRWLEEFNRQQGRSVGFYGMDVYGIPRSYEEVIEAVRELEPAPAARLKELLRPLEPHVSDMHSYARMLASGRPGFAGALSEAGEFIRENVLETLKPAKALDLERNMAVLIRGEKHYRAMVDPGMDSWNERVEYMRETVEELLRYYGPGSRGILWAHNTHVGDARATTMARQGRVNIGQLLRESLGPEQVAILGFGTGTGTVKAGREWGVPGEVMEIPFPVEGSYEHLFMGEGEERLIFIFDDDDRRDGPLLEVRGHRAIGVVYNPEREHLGNFVPTVLPLRYDAFVFFRSTTALKEEKFGVKP